MICNAKNTENKETACLRATKEQQVKDQDESRQATKGYLTQSDIETIWRQPRKVNWDSSTVSSSSENNTSNRKESGSTEVTSPASEGTSVFPSPPASPESLSSFTDDSEDMHKGMEEEFKSVLKSKKGKKGFTYKPRKLETSEPWKVSCNNKFSALDDTLDGTEDSKEPEQPTRQPEKSSQVKRPRGKKTRAGAREQERRQLLRQQSADIDELVQQIENVTVSTKETGTAHKRQQSTEVNEPDRQVEIVEDTERKVDTARSRTPSPQPEELTEEYYEQISKEFREFFSKQNRIKDWAAASRKPSNKEADNEGTQQASTSTSNKPQEQKQGGAETQQATSTTSTTQQATQPKSVHPMAEGKTDEEIKQMIDNMSPEEASELLFELGKDEPTKRPYPQVTFELDPRDRRGARYDPHEGDYRLDEEECTRSSDRRPAYVTSDEIEARKWRNYQQAQKRQKPSTSSRGRTQGGPRKKEGEMMIYEDGSVMSIKRSVIQDKAPQLLEEERQQRQQARKAWERQQELSRMQQATRFYGQQGSPDYALTNRTDKAPTTFATQPPSARKPQQGRRVPTRSYGNTPRREGGTPWGPEEQIAAKRPGAAGGGGKGGGGRKNLDEELARNNERLFLRRPTGHKVFWNGNREYNETYELNIYFGRRAEAFGHPEFPRRIPAEHRERANKAFNLVHSEGFTVMRADKNGHPEEDRKAYTTKIYASDKEILETVATRYDNSRQRYVTNREVEEMTRYAESLKDEMMLRQAITRDLKDVYEAFDRSTAANLLGGWGKPNKDSDGESTRPVAIANPEAEKRWELLNQLSGLELPELRTAQGELISREIKDADLGQIYYAVSRGMISGDIWSDIEGEVSINEVHDAYTRTFDRMSPEGVQHALFGDGPASTDSSLNENDYRKKMSHELKLLAALTGHTIPIEGHEENVPETFGMNYSRYVDRETDELRINAKDRTAVQKAYEQLYALVPREQLWEYLFTGARLPNARKIREIDGHWLMIETGRQTQLKGRIVAETYGTIEHQHREMKKPRSNIPDDYKGVVDEAYTRYTRGYSPDQIEQLIYGRVPPEHMEVDVPSSTASMAGGDGKSTLTMTDDPMDADDADAEAQRIQEQQYQEDLARQEKAGQTNTADDGMDGGDEEESDQQGDGPPGSERGDKDGKKKDNEEKKKNGKDKKSKSRWSSSSSSSSDSSEQSLEETEEETVGEKMDTGESNEAPKQTDAPEANPEATEKETNPQEQQAQQDVQPPQAPVREMVKKPIKPTSRTSAQGTAKFTPVESTLAVSGTGRATLHGAGAQRGQMSPAGFIPIATRPRGSGSSWASQQTRRGAIGQRYFQPNCRDCGTQHGLAEPCPARRQQRQRGGRGFNVSQGPRRPSAQAPRGGQFGQTMPARRPAPMPTQGTGPGLGASTGGAEFAGSYAGAAAKRPATGSVASAHRPAAPPVPTTVLGYKAPTKRVQSVRGKKTEAPPLSKENDSTNGMMKMAFMSGARVVLTEVTRHTANDMITLTKNTLVYTTVYGCCGYGIGWLDKANNREILASNPDMDYPLLMQFGDRTTQTEVYFFTGELRKVMSYATLRNERGELEPHQSMNAPLTDFIDPTTGRLKPSTVCAFTALFKAAPTTIQKRIGIVHRMVTEDVTKDLVTWRMKVCSTDGRKAQPLEIANENISFGLHEPMERGDWCAVDGFRVNRDFPNYKLGGCIFPHEVPGSVPAEEGYYPVRVSYTDRRQVLAATAADWKTEDYKEFRMVHSTMAEASGAVLHWESVLARERAERSSMPITGTRKLEKGLYEVTVTTEGLVGDDLVAACALRRTVKITELNDKGEKNIVMHGIVTATRFANDLIHMVTVRHVLTSKDEIENEREATGKPRAPEDPAELQKNLGQLKRLATGNEIQDDFYKKRILGKKLLITQTCPSANTDAYLAMVPKLGSKSCPIGTATRLSTINSIVNGFIVDQDELVTEQMIEDELAQLKRSGPSPRRQELTFAKKWLNLIDQTDLDEEQRMVMKLAAVDYVAAINVVAPGGTGKTHVGMNIVSCMIDRNRTMRKGQPWRIVVGTPNNSVAASFGRKLVELRHADIIGPFDVLVVQSTTQLMERNQEVSFSLVDKAKHILDRGYGSDRIRDLLKTFVQVVEENQQAQFNMGAVLHACTHYEEPCVVVATMDMIALHPTLTRNCTQFIAEETSRDPDLQFRTVICRLERLEQVILLGDPAQLPPYADIREIMARAKFGKSSLAEQATKRGLMHTCTLVNNRRSVVQLVECLKQMSEFYTDMVSMVETPDYQADPKFSMPPLVQADCPIVLLHTTSAHKRTRAAMISNPTQDRGAIELVRLTEGFQMIEGIKETDLIVATTYSGQQHYIENKLSKVAFTRGTGVETVDGSQGKQAGTTIYVTGRAFPPNTGEDDGDFTKNPKRSVVALGRAQYRVYIIGNFDYLTLDENSPIAKYILEAAKYTPVVDMKWYVDAANVYLAKLAERTSQGIEAYPEISTFGNGVLQYDFVGNTDPTRQDHIVDCNVNRHRGWKNRRLFEENVEEGYVPPTPGPFNVMTTLPTDMEMEKVATGMKKMGT